MDLFRKISFKMNKLQNMRHSCEVKSFQWNNEKLSEFENHWKVVSYPMLYRPKTKLHGFKYSVKINGEGFEINFN